MKITPKLLCLTWEGYPLHYLRDKGWGFLIPFTNDIDVNLARKIPLKKLLEKCPLLTTKNGQGSIEGIQQLSNIIQEDLAKKQFYSRLKKDKTEGLYKVN